jgi:predicted TIM-barrel fold metal-dependent hydrolase
VIVDSVVHIWAAASPERPWKPGAQAQRAVPLGADELLDAMNDAGVDRAVLVPPSWEGERNDVALAAASRYPDRFAVMGRLDPLGHESPSRLPDLLRQTGMLGLRITAQMSAETRSTLSSGQFEWLWRELERLDTPVFLSVPHAMSGLIDDIALRYPGLRIVLDHIGLPYGTVDDVAFRDIDRILPLGRHPNVAVKWSALPCYTKEPYPYRNLHPHLRKVHNAFGSERIFWGSDLSRSPISYRENLSMIADEIDWLRPSDKEWILGKGICRWLNWRANENEP